MREKRYCQGNFMLRLSASRERQLVGMHSRISTPLIENHLPSYWKKRQNVIIIEK